MMSARCPYPDCGAAVRFVLFRGLAAIRAYHGEELIFDAEAVSNPHGEWVPITPPAAYAEIVWQEIEGLHAAYAQREEERETA